MQNLIVSGKLPCTKDECATLAAIQLRIYELTQTEGSDEEKEGELDSEAKKLKDTESKAELNIEAKIAIKENEEGNQGDLTNKVEKVPFEMIKEESGLLKSISSNFSNKQTGMQSPVLVSGGWASLLFYMKSCSCFGGDRSLKVLTVKQLVSPIYKRSNDIIKLIKVRGSLPIYRTKVY